MPAWEKELQLLQSCTALPPPEVYAAARSFREAAGRGEDLEAVLADLVEIGIDSQDVGILGPLVEAMACHFIARDDAPGLRSLLARQHFHMFAVDALRNMVDRGEDIGCGLPILVGGGTTDSLDLRSILSKYLRRKPRRLTSIVEEMAGRNPSLPDLICDLVMWEKLDVSAVLPRLASLLDDCDERFRFNLAHMFRVAAESQHDLHEVEAVLERHLDDKNPDVRDRLAYALTRSSALRGDWEAVRRWQSHTDRSVRFGAAWGLSVYLNSDRPCSEALTSHLARSLLDDDKGVVEMAAGGLRAARRKGLPACADPDTLRALAGTTSQPVIEYLYLCALEDPSTAEHIRPGVREEKLRTALDEIARGAHTPPCLLCGVLPREASYSHDSDVPPEAEQLKPAGKHLACPSCGQRYERERTEEWDDMSLDIRIDLHRIPPPAAARHWEGLGSPLTWVRQEAAWVITLDALKNGRKSADILSTLLTHRDLAVVHECLRTALEGAPDAVLPWDVLRAHLEHPDSTVRVRSAALLSRHDLRTGDSREVLDLLSSKDSHVLAATVQRIDETADASPYLDRLRALLSHREERVRSSAQVALSRVHHGSASKEAWRSHLIAMLSSRTATVRRDAASGLRDLAGSGMDISEAFPDLLKLLHQREAGWAAMKAVIIAAHQGADMRAAAPALIAALGRRGYPYKGDALRTLEIALRQGADVSAAMRTFGVALTSTLTMYDALRILQEALAKGKDLGEAEPFVRQVLDGGHAYMREQGSRLLAAWLIPRGRWGEVVALLAHRRYDVRNGAALAVRDHAEACARQDALVRALEENLRHPNDTARAAARSTLESLRAVRRDLPAPAEPPVRARRTRPRS